MSFSCDKHGDEFLVVWAGRTRCKMCSQDRITEQRRKNKIRLVQYFGGKCIKCGYDKCVTALTFHHRNPNEKEFGVGGGETKSFNKLLEEAKKCDLLCHNCHSEVHSRPEDFDYKETVVEVRKKKDIN